MAYRLHRSRCAPGPASGHDIPSSDLDWHLTIAHPSIVTGLQVGVAYVLVDVGATRKQPLTCKVAGHQQTGEYLELLRLLRKISIT